ncbi:CAAX protease self-immunity [Lentzea xinjiangensis]|uniref:CAAX protease self-immunity n=1 Tax=Lentzea xinjiangensis TaxID=402600 RepID=A0A1H9UXV4_9PSEU|nr:CPBP family glutamic-type intramembrane protease [Lentzea xinjiangensis]SES14315.1 CAAX protease self-immunity [Lentzea xinjiangensis]
MRSNLRSSEFTPLAATALWPFTRPGPADGSSRRQKLLLLAIAAGAYALAFGWPIHLAVQRLTAPATDLVAGESDVWLGVAFNVLAIIVALATLVAFKMARAPLSAGRLTTLSLRSAFYAAGIWVLSQMLSAPISAVVDASSASHDSPEISMQADRGLQLVYWITWSIAAGVSEEIIANAAVVRTCELWNVPTWLMYVLVVVARLSFHIYYGLAVIEKVLWALMSAWAYRQGRLLWPLIGIHVLLDALTAVQASVDAPQLSVVSTLITVALVTYVIACLVFRSRRTHRAGTDG